MVEHPYPTLLVVEDSDEDFEALSRVMKQVCDISVPLLRCVDGDDALDFLMQTGDYADRQPGLPGLIILDLNLPGTDGREVLMQIKRDARLKMIPVVVFTTSSNPKDIEVCYGTGVNSYMPKPMDLQQLKISVRLFMNYWFKATVLPNRL